MAHTTKDRTKVLERARRIRGQVEAIEHAFACEQGFAWVLNTLPTREQ
jgi:DNA-binding FrmR family transcriptional regulator